MENMQTLGVGEGGRPWLPLVLPLLKSVTSPGLHVRILSSFISDSAKTLTLRWAAMELPLGVASLPFAGSPESQLEKGAASHPQWCAGQQLTTSAPERMHVCVSVLKFILNFTGIKDMLHTI